MCCVCCNIFLMKGRISFYLFLRKKEEVMVSISLFLCQMTTAIAIEDVRREVKILRALTGHNNLVRFYDAYEDHDHVYIVME